MLDIIGVGDTNIDLVIKVDHIPTHDEKVRGELLGKFPGGVTGNFCCAAARFGATTGVVAKIGNDEFGRLCLEDFIQRGINVDGMVQKNDVDTYFCVVHLDHTGEKALTIIQTSGFLPKKEEVNLAYVRNAKFVHMTTLDVDLVDYVFSNLADSSCRFSLDIEATASSAMVETWERIFGRLDVAFPNQAGLAALTKTNDIQAGAQILLDQGVKMVVVTCGALGVKIFKQDYVFENPIFAVEVKDSTGAGDCFNAVFIACQARDWPIERSAKYASAAAAMTIREVGARVGLPTEQEVAAFLREQGDQA